VTFKKLLFHFEALVVEGYTNNNYNKDVAQISALLEIQRNFDIDFKEVTVDGCI
jgi:hypothetical protein